MDENLNEELTQEEAESLINLSKVYLITCLYCFSGFVIIIGLFIFAGYANKKELYPSWVISVLMISVFVLMFIFAFGIIFLDKYCKRRYGHNIPDLPSAPDIIYID